jgi:hypothetical protein
VVALLVAMPRSLPRTGPNGKYKHSFKNKPLLAFTSYLNAFKTEMSSRCEEV